MKVNENALVVLPLTASVFRVQGQFSDQSSVANASFFAAEIRTGSKIRPVQITRKVIQEVA
jgi:hypothetical protein